jgi:hypothetical protein
MMLCIVERHGMFLFVYGLFNDAVSSSDYIAWNDRMINERWIGKDVEGSGRGLIEASIPVFFLEELRKTTENLSGKPLSGPRLNPGTPEYKAGLPTTQLLSAV